jgi:putative tricarboxylic transport membrane protein
MTSKIRSDRMVKADRISGTFLLLFSIYMAIESYRLGIGSLRMPGPGFIIFWAAIAIGILSVVVVLRTWSTAEEGRDETSIFGKKKLPKIGLVVLFLFLYAFFMESLGFIPVTLLLFVLLLGWIERKNWLLVAVVSVLITAVAYLIFDVWLQAQLPLGLLHSLRY